MKDVIVAFPGLQKAPSATQLLSRIQQMAATGKVGFDDDHFKENLTKRHVNMRQVLETLRKGSSVGAPTLDKWGDWRLKVTRKVAGRKVRVVVAVKADHCVCVTVY